MKKQDRGPAALVIDRSKWLRGDGWGYLLRGSDGKMCCLGFYGLACGLSADEIRNRSAPIRVASDSWPAWLLEKDALGMEGYYKLSAPNDDKDLSPEEREHVIAAEFARRGVTVTFVEATAGSASASEPPASQDLTNRATPAASEKEG